MVALLLGGVIGGCTRNRAPAPRPGPGSVEPLALERGLRLEDLGTQSLFRLQYQGPEGSGSLRLVLQLVGSERYRIETKDRFGRSLWRLDVASERATLLDDRARIFCTSSEGVRIPEVALDSLPLEALPAILLARLPGDLEPLGGGEFRDRAQRRWTASGSGAEVLAWTFWDAGEPKLWWTRENGGGGVLSHRAGSQLRWKRVAGEPLSAPVAPLVMQSGYREIACASWPGGLASVAED